MKRPRRSCRTCRAQRRSLTFSVCLPDGDIPYPRERRAGPWDTGLAYIANVRRLGAQVEHTLDARISVGLPINSLNGQLKKAFVRPLNYKLPGQQFKYLTSGFQLLDETHGQDNSAKTCHSINPVFPWSIPWDRSLEA